MPRVSYLSKTCLSVRWRFPRADTLLIHAVKNRKEAYR